MKLTDYIIQDLYLLIVIAGVALLSISFIA